MFNKQKSYRKQLTSTKYNINNILHHNIHFIFHRNTTGFQHSKPSLLHKNKRIFLTISFGRAKKNSSFDVGLKCLEKSWNWKKNTFFERRIKIFRDIRNARKIIRSHENTRVHHSLLIKKKIWQTEKIIIIRSFYNN